MLSEMATRLNEELDLEDPIAVLTPYDWWKRTKSEKISVPMPKEIRMAGRSPIFLWRDIKRWYPAYKEAEELGL